jgi:ABC-type Fe3+-siderophore transport system permease subunit
MTENNNGAKSTKRIVSIFLMLLLIMVLVALLTPLLGPTKISLANVFNMEAESTDQTIFFSVRLPRVLFGLIAGAALSLAGGVYQAILRNDLAEPYTLGVASGASVGALLVFHFVSQGSFLLMPLASFFFAAIAVGVIYGLSALRSRMASPTTLILAGVTLNFFFGATILLIQYLSDPFQMALMVRWLMGGLEISSYRVILVAFSILIVSAVVLFAMSRKLNLLALGDNTAHNLGVAVGKTRFTALAISSMLAAFIVSFAGPIGFVGLMVPHIMRRLVGADHRVLLPAVVLAGGSFLVVCDTIGRTFFSPTEIPVGVVTAFLGAPFFLWLLYRKAH